MQDQLLTLQSEALAQVEQAADLEALEQLRIDYLGKKGKLSKILGGMGKLPPEERPVIGALANTFKEALQSSLDQRKQALSEAQLLERLEAERLDVTMPGSRRLLGRIHPLQATIDRMLDIFVGMGYTVVHGPEIETEYYNFEALNTPADHPARDMQDTLYLENGYLMRTQTSSVQVRYMEQHQPPLRIVHAGRVMRRDTVDATHSAVFHQMEILAVGENLTFSDLKGTLNEFITRLLGKRETRFRPSYFPFTEPSAEMDVRFGSKWLEIFGCGMVDPNVFQAVGYDPERYTGFAAGIGIERMAMLLHGIQDIRLFYTSDLRFLSQF
ncbi:phenylalanine--tRNA ligase subunit alpha [Thermostichus vulcanus]|uniref:Phenylalanine--tRNA ligase alpha subunit n=1 Tax=Thermostichus vulcanus str. 'Rupite' TaxID=2813851 RepID=A0ABT0CAV2_THEVL|nr:phenylalanine--tRNA ligase subunit alpha [Thermostichus vulcanus]MCJ2542913.1 phenylalanine--tRNA ligase subunit alpha [Thermostichus vulcanus str. 'Rupite']